jgi:hypothetical protein
MADPGSAKGRTKLDIQNKLADIFSFTEKFCFLPSAIAGGFRYNLEGRAVIARYLGAHA